MSVCHERLENIVGALSVAIADGLSAQASQHLPRNDPPAAITIIGRSPGWTIRQLSKDLKLSHAATVRLVDRLAEDDLITRSKSQTDGRAVNLTLTAAGQTIYEQIITERQSKLSDILKDMSASELLALEMLCEKLLPAAVGTQENRSRVCRLCDTKRCQPCPINTSHLP